MSVTTTQNRITHTGDGVTSVFAFPYLFLNNADIQVSVAGVPQTVGFTVTGAGSASGGNVTFTTAPANDAAIVLYRDPDSLQNTVLSPNDPFPSKALETMVDKVTLNIQRLREIISRSLSLSDADTNGAGAYRAQQNRIQDVADPVNDQDAANKRWTLTTIAASLTTGAGNALLQLFAASTGAGLIGWIQSGVGAVFRWVQDKLRETISVKDFGATGDGATNDAAAFTKAQAEAGSGVVLCSRGTYNIDAAAPDFDLTGDGTVIASGVQTSAGSVKYNPEREIFAHTPKDYQRAKVGTLYPPPPFATDPGTQSHYRTVFSLGSQLGDKNKLAAYVTAFGNFNGANFNQWFAVDAFGGDTLMYAYNVERTVAVGSEVLAWFGAPSYAYLVTYQHDWFRKPSSNPYLPGEVGWNANGLETLFPGIGNRIAAYTGYATSTAGAAYTTAVGRDALNHCVAGTNNTFMGYGAGGMVFDASNSVGIGVNALRNMVFGHDNTAVGIDAGRDCLDSYGSVFLGIGAGRQNQNATGAVLIGHNAGADKLNAERSVIIGRFAGESHTSDLTDKLIITNDVSTAKPALISGSFAANTAGIAIMPENIRARLHVRGNTTGSGSALSPSGPGLLVEGQSQSTVTIESNDTGLCQIRFADTASNQAGGLEYSHSLNTLTFSTNATSQLRIENTGDLRPWTDNTKALGSATFRWSTVYAGTGAINTSDEREKQQIKPIDAAVLRAWAKVEYCQFKFNDAVELKGDGARWHVGLIAQRIKEAFESEGLDAFAQGLLCYDEWGDEFIDHPAEYEDVPAVMSDIRDEDGKPIVLQEATQRLVNEAWREQVRVAGSRYGIRYEEALALECAYLRSRLPA